MRKSKTSILILMLFTLFTGVQTLIQIQVTLNFQVDGRLIMEVNIMCGSRIGAIIQGCFFKNQ